MPAIFMPPTSKKLREHIGLGSSVCLSVRLLITPFVGSKTREPLELRTLNFICSMSTKNKPMHIFFLIGPTLYGKVMPHFFDSEIEKP